MERDRLGGHEGFGAPAFLQRHDIVGLGGRVALHRPSNLDRDESSAVSNHTPMDGGHANRRFDVVDATAVDRVGGAGAAARATHDVNGSRIAFEHHFVGNSGVTPHRVRVGQRQLSELGVLGLHIRFSVLTLACGVPIAFHTVRQRSQSGIAFRLSASTAVEDLLRQFTRGIPCAGEVCEFEVFGRTSTKVVLFVVIGFLDTGTFLLEFA